MKAFLVTLVRHGETTLNVQRLLQGHRDIPLSDAGIKQAELLGLRMKTLNQTFNKVYSSDLTRAYHTAKLVLQHSGNTSAEIKQDLRLRERCYGSAEGKPAKDLIENAKKLNIPVHKFTPEGAESGIEVSKRAASFFEDLCKLAQEEASIADNETDETVQVLVVTHGGWIQCLLRHLHSDTEMYELNNFDPSKSLEIHKNTAVSEFFIHELKPENGSTQRFKLIFKHVNNTTHLAVDEQGNSPNPNHKLTGGRKS